jgi:hypothetical protein
MDAQKLSSPSICVDIINKFDPQLLSEPIAPRIKDTSLCSSTDPISFTVPDIPSIAIASQDTCNLTSAHSTIELEDRIDLDIERTSSLTDGNSVEDIDPAHSRLE